MAVVAVAALALTGCSSRGGDAAASNGASGGDTLIGIALPDKTSVNWVEAGQLFTDGLTEKGLKADVQYADTNGSVASQQAQIQSMITKGAKVIVIGAADTAQLATVIEQAHSEGIKIISYDRLIQNSSAVDYYVAYNNYQVGVLQGQALLDGMAAKDSSGPYNIELFSGSQDDSNSSVFFDGAMSVLQPKIDSGDVVVKSGQTSIAQTATEDWSAENAQSRMDTLVNTYYASGTPLDGVLSPNDTLARAIITSVTDAGLPAPIVTGQDSEEESIRLIMEGKQYSTINKDTGNLVKQAITMVTDIVAGTTPETNDKANNGSVDVPTYYLDPVVVTKANAAEAYANDATRLAVVKEYQK